MPLADDPFGQLLVASTTPFHPDGTLHVDDFTRHVDALVDAGADGVVVGGTTGEGATLTDAERVELTRCAVRAVHRRATVVASVGTPDTVHAIELARAAAAAGADGLMVGTPSYSRPSQAGVLAHLRAVADATDLPVMLYDVPARTGTPLSHDTVARAAEHPNICAVKDATGSLTTAAWLLDRTDLHYFAGDDAAVLPMLAAGGTGFVGVAANIAPAMYRRLLDAVRDGDLRTATEQHRRLAPVVRALTTHAPAAAATKLVLHALGRITSPRVRLPLVGPEPADVDLIRADLRTADRHDLPGLADLHLDAHAAYGGALAIPAGRRPAPELVGPW